ncbi:hypothetical protein ACP70R_034776 [Stipagrostis hirtigluma subsp. patula]
MEDAGGCLSMPVVEGHGEEEECSDLEPFFFDEASAVADHERRVRREQEAARKEELRALTLKAQIEGRASVRDYDPKQGGTYYTRFFSIDFSKFNINEESPLGPMRHTCKPGPLSEAVNILSVRVASSDVGFPIHVYGTVIARDTIDRKCVYLFRCDRDHSQLINSEDESLILTGPKRGLMLLDDAFVEIDLKIKDHQGQEKELSKGFISISGITRRLVTKSKIERKSLATRLSTMEVMYAVVEGAVEATISIEVLWGNFSGTITASTTSIRDGLLLYDSKVAGAMTSVGIGVMQLLQRVVSVSLVEKLLVTFVARIGDHEHKRTIGFTPNRNGGGERKITVGVTKLLVKVVWSTIM